MARQYSRRRLLAALTTTVGVIAGCQTAQNTTGSASPTTAAGTTAENTAAPPTADATTAGGELDLREANVMAVALTDTDGGTQFDVTLYHDDDGESGYANWWQVETLAGDRLGRRKLLHAHGTREFTRSETIELPAGTTHVVVRGHDQTHGYGGRAMIVAIPSGATEIIDQGPEPRSFADYTPSV
ncbi:MAG: hypothetical protein SVG88_12435 [Halobacteriales archaeon]|nr:hypothetical protein [Halobacteriales archaeon]